MKATRNEVQECVIQCLVEMSPLENKPPINDETNPMWNLCLDSHDGVNLASKLTETFKHDIPKDLNPLVDDARKRPRRIGEIVDLVCKLISEPKEKTNG